MTASEQARADVEAWRKERSIYDYVLEDGTLSSEDEAALIARLTPIYERAQRGPTPEELAACCRVLRERAQGAEYNEGLVIAEMEQMRETLLSDLRERTTERNALRERAERAEAERDELRCFEARANEHMEREEKLLDRVRAEKNLAEADVARLRGAETDLLTEIDAKTFLVNMLQGDVARLREALITAEAALERVGYIVVAQQARNALAATEPKSPSGDIRESARSVTTR